MFYDAVANTHGLKHGPVQGAGRAAPDRLAVFSQPGRGSQSRAPTVSSMRFANRPNYVMFSSTGRKDSIANIEATGEFVHNVATWDLRDAMNQSSANVGSGVDEFELAGLEKAPSRLVKPPRVAASRWRSNVGMSRPWSCRDQWQAEPDSALARWWAFTSTTT